MRLKQDGKPADNKKGLHAITTNNFFKILEGFHYDEFSLRGPKCRYDEFSGDSIMTNFECDNDE